MRRDRLARLCYEPVVLPVRTLVREAAYRLVPPSRLLRRAAIVDKRIALTFDDGPDDMTIRYLDLLDRLGVPASFFVVGDRAEQHPDVIREYVRRGHHIAAHGHDHRRFPSLSYGELADQLRMTDRAIGPQLTGVPWVRPPYGALGARSMAQILAAGWAIALWSVDSKDYELHEPDAVVARCTPDAIAPGDVLLFHEGQQWTLDALPRIVDGLHAAGYECVTMADLFAR
jgi:peptidoglycan/xylan/chitin deacetylase (PgdA/CDA1 family)